MYSTVALVQPKNGTAYLLLNRPTISQSSAEFWNGRGRGAAGTEGCGCGKEYPLPTGEGSMEGLYPLGRSP